MMTLRFVLGSILIALFYIKAALSQSQCPELPVRRYVEYSCTKERNNASECIFSCTPGYELRSRSAMLRTCRCFTSSLCIWTGPIATCVASTSTTAITTISPPSTSVPVIGEVAEMSDECPIPDMGDHLFQAVDTWPTGGVFRIDISKESMSVDNGWSVLVNFSRNLPDNVTVMSWNSEVVSSKNKYLGLSSVEHNRDLTGMNLYSFTVVILGTTMQDMDNYEASVGFYQERVDNPICFTATNDMSSIRNVTTVTSTTALPSSASTETTRLATTQSQTTSSTTTTTQRSTTTTTRSTTTTSTTTTRSTEPPVQPSSNIDVDDVHNVRINSDAVRRYRGRCNVLLDALRVENPSYPAPGRNDLFRFNGHLQLHGQSSRVNDWTLKVVFSKRIRNVQLWEARFERKSNDDRVYIFRPLSWNSNLRSDFAFQIIPEMRSRSIPQAVLYLCPSGVTPDYRHAGIFERVETTATTRTTTRATRPTIITTQSTTRPTTQPTLRPSSTFRPVVNNARCRSPAGKLPTSYRQTQVSFRPSPRNEKRPYDYNEVLTMSILFYEAQRSGKLPSNNRIPWRGDSGLRDGCDVGHDLTGGWYDAGDHIKFGLPMAWTATTLAWGVIEFKDAYLEAGEFRHVLNSLKWATDYFIKAHTSKYELYGQVGSGPNDHGYWGRPEEMRMSRPSYKITRSKPGSDLAAETAAALAATSVVFRDVDRSYADSLVRHARELYEFADKYRESYHKSIPEAEEYYRSFSGYRDELVWGALWLYRATNQRSYLNDAIRKYRQFGMGGTPRLFSWDDKRAGCQVLMANFTGEAQYRNHVLGYQRFLRGAPRTPRGLTWLSEWGSNRYAANAAFIALAAAKVPRMTDTATLFRYARSQIHFLLGGAGRSYVVGYGNNPPRRPHHRSSSCRAPPSSCQWGNAFHNNRANPNILYGALVGGPALNGTYRDDRTHFVMNEVATDYNAGFQGALAGLKYYQIQARRN